MINCRIIFSQSCIILSLLLSLFVDNNPPHSCICILTSYGFVTSVYSLQYTHPVIFEKKMSLVYNQTLLHNMYGSLGKAAVHDKRILKDRLFDHDYKQKMMFISRNVLTPNKTGKGSCSTLYLPHTHHILPALL